MRSEGGGKGEGEARTVGELAERLVEVLEPPHDVREGRGRPEVLLLEAELLSDYNRKSKSVQEGEGKGREDREGVGGTHTSYDHSDTTHS